MPSNRYFDEGHILSHDNFDYVLTPHTNVNLQTPSSTLQYIQPDAVLGSRTEVTRT